MTQATKGDEAIRWKDFSRKYGKGLFLGVIVLLGLTYGEYVFLRFVATGL